MRYTKQDVKNELQLLQKRLRTIEKHTGFTLEIDKDYYLNMASRKKAVSQLKLIKWSNINKRDINLTHIDVKSINKLHGKELTVKLVGNEKDEFLSLIKKGEKVTHEKIKIKIYSEEAKQTAKNFVTNRSDDKWWNEYKTARDEKALNNYYNNVKTMGDATADPALKLVAELIKNKIKDGILTAQILNKSNLYKISGINLFDSDQGDALNAASASHILQVLREEIPITDAEIYDLGHVYGMSDDEIEEIL